MIMKESAAQDFNSRRGNCAQAVALAWKDKKNNRIMPRVDCVAVAAGLLDELMKETK